MTCREAGTTVSAALTADRLPSLIELATMEQLVGVDAVAPSHHRDALPRLQALANHGELFLDAPAATPLLA